MSGEQRIALVSCVKSKQSVSARAKDLYTSTLFRSARAYAESRADEWWVLSAEHGLLHPDQVIAPYERTLNKMGVADRRAWSEHVMRQLAAVLRPGAEVIILAGERYRSGILPLFAKFGCSISVPLEGLSFGKQLQWLKEANSGAAMEERRATSAPDERGLVIEAFVEPITRDRVGPVDADPEPDLERFYRVLQGLAQTPAQGRRLSTCTAKSGWPDRGVYFFNEPGERRGSDTEVARVVRVGTHGVSKNSKSTLWGRLRTHRGGLDGRGNHRGSIFRLHVGAALLKRDQDNVQGLPSWGKGQSAPKAVRQLEVAHEKRVSAQIGAMSVLWVAVPDAPGPDSLRAYIERNTIGLLSAGSIRVDPPSPTWLGLHSPRSKIRSCGLWNLKHVSGQYDPSFLQVLEELARRTAHYAA